MKDDEPKKRISKVIDRKRKQSIDSFEDLEDAFEDLAQKTTNENN
jgi:hypothetical protein